MISFSYRRIFSRSLFLILEQLTAIKYCDVNIDVSFIKAFIVTVR
jgi:hypothetical protein